MSTTIRTRCPAACASASRSRGPLPPTPEILLCDEPFSALDEIDRARPARGIRPPGEENGKTAVFITHSISEALEIGDRIVVLKRPAKIAYDVSFDADTGREERELIRSRIGEVLAV